MCNKLTITKKNFFSIQNHVTKSQKPIKKTLKRHSKFDQSNDEGQENYLEKTERNHKSNECWAGLAC